MLTVLAIGLQVTLVLTIVGLSQGMVEASRSRQSGIGADITIRPPGSSLMALTSAPMPEGVVARFVEKVPHVTQAQATVILPVGGFDSIAGIDITRFDRMTGGLEYLEGGPFQKPDDILLDEHFARQRNLKVGDTVELGNYKWHVRGIVGSGKLSRAFVQKKVLQELTANTDKISQVYLKVDDQKNIPLVVETLKKQLEGYQIYSMEDLLSYVTIDNVPGLTPFIRVIIGLSIVFGFLVVFLAMYTAVLERTREIGILKALGASPGYIVGMLVRETVFLAIIGSLFGIALAFAARWAIMSFVPASLPVVVVPEWWWRAGLIALAGSVLGALYPGTKAARQDTIEALAYD